MNVILDARMGVNRKDAGEDSGSDMMVDIAICDDDNSFAGGLEKDVMSHMERLMD